MFACKGGGGCETVDGAVVAGGGVGIGSGSAFFSFFEESPHSAKGESGLLTGAKEAGARVGFKSSLEADCVGIWVGGGTSKEGGLDGVFWFVAGICCCGACGEGVVVGGIGLKVRFERSSGGTDVREGGGGGGCIGLELPVVGGGGVNAEGNCSAMSLLFS